MFQTIDWIGSQQLLGLHYFIYNINVNIDQIQTCRMLKIFGRNNNNLFRHSHKQTYSMPQSLPFSQPILKCACGYDHIAILTASGRLYFVFQAKFYLAQNVPVLWDIASSDNTIAMHTRNNEILVWDFDEDKLTKQHINYTKIKVQLEHEDSIKKIQMGASDIFLITELGKVYHFKRNEWYETKTYSNIESIELNHRIIDACSGPLQNFFISYEGLLFMSSKQNPFCLSYVETPHKFIKVASNQYNVGITKKGELMIWGNSIHGNYKEPTQFSKLTKKFVDVKLDKENGYALADDGEVWVWGLNSNGQLGLSDYEVRIKPFPLITLQKNHVYEIFCGYSYACCLCEPSEKDSKGSIKVVNRTVSQLNAVRQHAVQNKNKQKEKSNLFNEYLQYEIRENQHTHAESPSFPKKQMQKKSNVKKLSCSPTTSMKNSGVHRKKSSNPSQDYYSTKKSSQKFKQAPLKHQKQQKSKSKIQQSDWLMSERENDSIKDYRCQGTHQQQSISQLEIIQLKQENQRLKQKVSEQEDIIGDITCKIRLLEEAIDEHERNLTSRDHILQEYQLKEQDYITHIEELQSKIDEIIKNKEKNNEITVIYEDMKTNFEKQRSYYIDKIKDYEVRLHMQQSRYPHETDQLKRRSVLNPWTTNKQNSRPTWSSHSPIKAKPEGTEYTKKGQANDRHNLNSSNNANMNSSMEQVIDHIESNKSRITKSANKLIAMLDISQ